MQKGAEILRASAGEPYEREFAGDGDILVQREGYSRIRHVFVRNGKTLARLKWYGMRRAVYEADGIRYDINIGALAKRIRVISEGGSESMLIERSRGNARQEDLRVEMAEGDNFCLTRSYSNRLRYAASLELHKAFYASTLLVYQYDVNLRTQTTVRIIVMPMMKREARFAHRLLALVVCRIILERRKSGARPHRMKERQDHFTSSARARERKKRL
jgi:hypothetical protein